MTRLIPRQVKCVELRADVAPYTLWPAERLVVRRATARRQAEFATVRACARQALLALGAQPGPILPGPYGEPTWPRGVVGSMTHCEGYRAAAVCLDSSAAAIGIDAEVHAPLPDGVLELVARPEELAALARLTEHDPSVAWDRLLFSIKESVYKASGAGELSFAEIRVEVFPRGGAFVARTPQPRLPTVEGFFRAGDELLLSAVVVTRDVHRRCA